MRPAAKAERLAAMLSGVGQPQASARLAYTAWLIKILLFASYGAAASGADITLRFDPA